MKIVYFGLARDVGVKGYYRITTQRVSHNNVNLKRLRMVDFQTRGSLLTSSPFMVCEASRERTCEQGLLALASPFAGCSCVTSRDSTKWTACS